MFGKIAIAAGTIATAAMITAAPAAAGPRYDRNADRVTVDIGYNSNRINRNNRVNRNNRNNRNNHNFRDFRDRRDVGRQRNASLNPQQRHRRILRNRGGMAAWKVKRKLRNRGFARIRITDNLLPRYQFRACRNGKRFDINTNRFGDVGRVERVGRCRGWGFRDWSFNNIRDRWNR